MLYKELTEKILEACLGVSNELGAGFLVTVYEKALFIGLRDKGLNSRLQVPLLVMFRGKSVGEFFADILVENVAILELKQVSARASVAINQLSQSN